LLKSYFSSIKILCSNLKKPKKLKKKKVSITLSPELVEELKREARYKNLSLSEYIEKTLKTIYWRYYFASIAQELTSIQNMLKEFGVEKILKGGTEKALEKSFTSSSG